MKIQTGDVLIYHSNGFLPWAIRKTTNSFWNHVGIVSEKTKYGYIVYEAQAKGIIKSEYTFEYLQRRIDEGTIIVRRSKVRLTNVKSNCEKYLGIPYGKTTLIQILWMIITKRVPKHSDGVKRLICSEFDARVLYDSSNKKIDFQKEFLKQFDFIFPGEIAISIQLDDLE